MTTTSTSDRTPQLSDSTGGSAHTGDTKTEMAALAAQQRRVLGIVAGLDDTQLLRAVLPSGWTVVGMVAHLTSGTRFWLREVMLDDGPHERVDDDFDVDPATPPGEVVQAYVDTCAATTTAIEALTLDTVPAWWPEGLWGGWRLDDLHEVLLHLLVETACHAGHLDAARELIDGGTWDYATGKVSAR